MPTDIIGIMFSKDRAMQLDAALKSFSLHLLDPEFVKLKVICAATSELFLKQYKIIQTENPNVDFVFQENFQSDLLSTMKITASLLGRFTTKLGLLHRITTPYVLFLVDDNIFVHDFRLSDIMNAMAKETKALGFSLQMGLNIHYCYPLDIRIQFPTHETVYGDVIKYRWAEAGDGLNYPLEVSSSVYRWKEIAPLLAGLSFSNPNTLEAQMAANAALFRRSHPELLCYRQSITFCNPVNKVQSVYNNKAGGRQEYSADALARKFENGYRIDIRVYQNIIPEAGHQEVELAFSSGEELNVLKNIQQPKK